MKRTSVELLFQALIMLLVLSLVACSDRNSGNGKGADQKSPGEGLKYGNPASFLVAQTRVLGTIGDDENPADTSSGYRGHSATPPANQEKSYEILFNEQGSGVAYKASKAGKVAAFFNGKGGLPYGDIGAIAISADGRRCSYTAKGDKESWYLVVDGREAAEFHHLGTPVFSPDSKHVALQASANENWYIILDEKQSKGGKYSYDQPVFSGDSTKLAFIENLDDGKRTLHISDLRLKSLRVVDSVASSVLTSADHNQLAVVIGRQDKQRLVRIPFDRPDLVTDGPEYDTVTNPQFSADGKSVTYTASAGGTFYQVLDGSKERLEAAPLKQPVVNPGRKEVALILPAPNGMRLHRAFSGAGKGKVYDDIAGIAFSKDGTRCAYAATRGNAEFLVVDGKEGPHFDKVVSPIFSLDGKKVIYRARKDGKRFVVVADTEGKTVRQHPSYAQVFQPVVTPDGKSVAYGVLDGRKLVWMVEKL